MNTKNRTISMAVAVVIAAMLISSASADQVLTKKWFPGHYLYATAIGKVSPSIRQGAYDRVKDNPYFSGYKLIYLWANIETAPGVYDFSQIITDLDFMHANGKKVILMIHNRQFACAGNPWPLPAYMKTTAIYEGGTFVHPDKPCNLKPKLYLESVADRFADLWTALGAVIDKHPALAMVQHDETSMPGIENQPGFNTATYLSNYMRIHDAIAAAFPTTIFVQYVNWASGMTPEGQDLFMKNLVEKNKNGFGGPDMLNAHQGDPTDPRNALSNAYGRYYGEYAGIAPIAMSHQTSSYTVSSARATYDFALNQLGAHFVAWQTGANDPNAVFDINDVIDVINEEKGRINTDAPSNLVAAEVPIPPPYGIRVITD